MTEDGSTPDPRSWAIAHHGDQRYGERPYSAHLDEVAALAEPWGPVAVTVAYLHDVVEDTAADLQEVESVFGAEVAACVALVTDPPGRNRAERKAEALRRWASCPPEHHTALVVKAADRLANLRACVRDGRPELLAMYRREHAGFRGAAYRPGLCDELWAAMDEVLESGT